MKNTKNKSVKIVLLTCGILLSGNSYSEKIPTYTHELIPRVTDKQRTVYLERLLKASSQEFEEASSRVLNSFIAFKILIQEEKQRTMETLKPLSGTNMEKAKRIRMHHNNAAVKRFRQQIVKELNKHIDKQIGAVLAAERYRSASEGRAAAEGRAFDAALSKARKISEKKSQAFQDLVAFELHAQALAQAAGENFTLYEVTMLPNVLEAFKRANDLLLETLEALTVTIILAKVYKAAAEAERLLQTSYTKP